MVIGTTSEHKASFILFFQSDRNNVPVKKIIIPFWRKSRKKHKENDSAEFLPENDDAIILRSYIEAIFPFP